MRKKEIEERVRLLQYENVILRHDLAEVIKHLKVTIKPIAPFSRIEVHKLGCSWGLPSYNDLKNKYKEIQ
jgi:hypothetical protein